MGVNVVIRIMYPSSEVIFFSRINSNLHSRLKASYNPEQNIYQNSAQEYNFGIYTLNIESQECAYNWCVWFWTQQVRHGSLTRQSSHRSSYKVHRRHRSVSLSIPPFLSRFSYTGESYQLWTFTHLILLRSQQLMPGFVDTSQVIYNFSLLYRSFIL